ncbi:hypothetical protein CLQ_14363 (plasmid) [Clostridium botulinum Af84]|uniref:hypothetical protein n=1 Tax=Clostridium botulinum TaxID=1491 RepID=UPI00035BAB21|nr:hypothetical protein [Clostridium botulinum]APR02631.1 hypothetical protein RSJ2_3738 [Clostridium botulinum]AUN19844.1 hypothetical protein B2M06_20090 [Clostridium botulinum]EPS54478.1 hypothetical protein CLQ_14363 [Clostridium botulinum Af84]NFM82788.1 hypothetical protein [Clostridium botulinum]NFP10090.1 hypothetical protein [Clostridium botulinum]
MDIKTRLKERLLEIPVNSTAYREKYRLADDLNIKVEEIKILLDELVERNILKEKFQYICPTCRDTTIMDNELLQEFIIEDGCFECDNCFDLINPNKDKTGYVFYDIKDKQALINW